MNLLLIDNGSSYLEDLKALLKGRSFDVLGYPFVPEQLRERAAKAERVIFSAAHVPIGIDLPYYGEELRAIKAIAAPVLGIGRGAAILLEAHGGKVKVSGGEMSVKKAPSSWRENRGQWSDAAGNIALVSLPEDWKEAVRRFISA